MKINKTTTTKTTIPGLEALVNRVKNYDCPGVIGAQLMFALMVLTKMDRGTITKDSTGLREALAILRPDVAVRVVEKLHSVLDAIYGGRFPLLEPYNGPINPDSMLQSKYYVQHHTKSASTGT